VTCEGCHHKKKRWVAGGGSDHRRETEYREQGTILKGKEKKEKRERREETYGRETKLINRGYQQKESLVVLRFLGTGEQSASIEKLTGLSSEVLLNLAGWFRSFGN